MPTPSRAGRHGAARRAPERRVAEASRHRNGIAAASARRRRSAPSDRRRSPTITGKLLFTALLRSGRPQADADHDRHSTLSKSDPQRSRSRRERQACRLSARAALGPSFGVRMDSGSDRIDPQRQRPRRARHGGQPRRRVRRADRRLANRAGDRRAPCPRATDFPADGEFPGGGRGHARVADRWRQPEPQLSRRSRRRADRRDRRLHRAHAAAARAVSDRSAFGRQLAALSGRQPARARAP
ncbi:succinylglutamate desuccinylase/aspartoacylase family protein [Burkholderia pseudomallei]|nr:succinylglutamate desuccinylase/aspartoacylase family protein [Burkholderia pseudomallei]